ncbi:MAG: MerR family transcriptional regulator [Sphingobacteriales bacterium]|nr:MerR family transcriptional regulator [Sphingobacteriales bacterium]MBI3718016.1 MerR family transcriptional regulator [Sphingobacteriales bacterium]
MNSFTIKDIENLSGIKAHTIRIWEQRYSFLKPQRTETNIRYYSCDEVKTILNIALLNKYGFKISHIDKMNEVEMKEKILSLSGTLAQQERIVNDLIQQMIDLDMEEFERIADNYILARGIEKTIIQIIFPFLEKTGILWLTNHINPAQEHLVTNIIRQKLIVGIEGVSTPLKINKSVLLFLPEGEYHELGLLFLYYLLKSRGATVIYLGANIPMVDMEFVAKLKKPDYLYTHLSTVGNSFNFEKFISLLDKRFKGSKVVISGQLTHVYEKKIPAHFKFIKSFSEVFDFIHNL